MTTLAAVLVGLALASIAYTWLGYPLLIAGLARLRGAAPDEPVEDAELPTVTVLVAAHNEAKVIETKLRNCVAQRYPADRLDVLVASDGSKDGTQGIVRSFMEKHRQVRLYDGPPAGKTATQNAAVKQSAAEIVVFTNADTILAEDCVLRLARRFTDPHVGMVGARLAWHADPTNPTGAGVSFYWSFEYALWRGESRLGLLVWAPGACMAMRRELFEPMNPAFGEDVVLPIQIRLSGRRVVFADDAVAYEASQPDARSEFRVRTRMVLRSFAGTVDELSRLPWSRAASVGLAIVSHKVLRWLTAYALAVAAAGTAVLVVLRPTDLVLVIAGAQAIAYSAALLGWLLDRVFPGPVPPFTQVYYFLLSVVAAGAGVTRALKGERMTSFGAAAGSRAA